MSIGQGLADHHGLDDVLDELDAHAAERGMPLGEYLLLCSRIFESTDLDEDFLETALGGRR